MEGKLRETTGEFDEKRISLGTMAVGVERKVKAHLKNTGEMTSVFFVSPVPEAYGVVEFGEKVVSNESTTRQSYFLEIPFRNVDVKTGINFSIIELPTTVKIDETRKDPPPVRQAVIEDEGQLPVFFVSPTRGDIPAGGSFSVRVTFTPRVIGDYEKVLQLFVAGQPDTSRPYMSLLCKGFGMSPKLTFDRQLIQLPTVPLGIFSRSSFSIINNGFAYVEVKFRVSPTISTQLQVTFPDGTE